MKKLTLAALFFVFFSSTNADAISRKKVLIGSILAVSGALVAYEAVDRCLFSDCGEAQATVGLVMVGTGATLVVWGLLQKDKPDQLLQPKPGQPNFRFGFVPRRKGVAGGAI